MPRPVDLSAARDQAGVLSRAQLLATGASEGDVRRLLRRRELVAVHPGVYRTHGGPLPWDQRAWAAVLWASPAALHGASALRAYGSHPTGSSATDPVHVAIERDRRLLDPPGVRLHRIVDWSARARPHLSPPRVTYEHAVLDLAVERGGLDAVAVLTAAVGSRRTTAGRLRDALATRGRVAGRAWLRGVLDDLAEGTCSVLEHGYLTRVERPHDLPRAQRQAAERSRGGMLYRDARIGSLLVELDGRAFHDSVEQRDLDLARDLEAVLGGSATVRLSWGLVFREHCRTAATLGLLLRRLGWTGTTRRCPACP